MQENSAGKLATEMLCLQSGRRMWDERPILQMRLQLRPLSILQR
jgi:hypothetical protein